MTKVYSKHYETGRYDISTVTFDEAFLDREHAGQKHGDKIVKLVDKKLHEIVMSSSKMEQKTNEKVIEKANGKILIAGLGLGMILFQLQEMKNVEKITVVEKSLELISFIKMIVGDKLSEKINIVNSDIFKYETDEKFDLIYFDIWNNVCGDNWEDMIELKMKFKKNISSKPKRDYIFSWRERDCLELREIENAS